MADFNSFNHHHFNDWLSSICYRTGFCRLDGLPDTKTKSVIAMKEAQITDPKQEKSSLTDLMLSWIYHWTPRQRSRATHMLAH